MEGHITWNCTAPRRAHINTVDTEGWAAIEEEFAEPNKGNHNDCIESSIHAFSKLSLEEKGKFVARMNQGESPRDFQEA